ncbi:sugar phosphate isomerase/epimerase [Candidatus Aerophobetes bacterium]|nr:sugar phosphate isomerase/epimerase [Candidatus Aerophobetes bacterium]
MASIKLGMMTCFAVKRWPEPEVWCKIVGEELGLRYAQFSFDLLDPRTIPSVRDKICEDIKNQTEKFNIQLTSAFTGLASYSFSLLLHPDIGMRMDAIRWYEEAIVASSRMGALGCGGHVGALSMKDIADEKKKKYLMEFLVEALQYLSFVAKQNGQKFLLWEPMPLRREPPCTIDEAKALYELVNKNAAVPVQFCLDLGHQCAHGTSGKDRDTYEWLCQFAPYSPVIHIQQTDGKGDRHWPFTKEYNAKGIINPEKVVEAIEKSGAKEVVLLFEIIHPFEENEEKVLTDLRESVEYWRRYVRE